MFPCRADYLIILSEPRASHRLVVRAFALVVTPCLHLGLGTGLPGLGFPRIHAVCTIQLPELWG